MDIHDLGQKAEENAYRFLEKQGLKLLERNYRCFFGEIDLIMLDDDEVVFIEVRMRTDTHFITPIESVSLNKQKKIIRTATHYLQKKKWYDQVPCRFDIVGIAGNQPEWIKDAFSIDLFN